VQNKILNILEEQRANLMSVKMPGFITETNALYGLMTTTEGVSLHQDWFKTL
jgi:hypothetical protein